MKFNSLKFALALAVGHLVYALIPLICTVARIPDTIVVDAESSVGHAVQVGYLQPDGTVRQHATCPQEDGLTPVYLPVDDPNRSNLCFGICSATGDFAIKSVKLMKWYFLPFELTLDSLQSDYEPTEGLVCDSKSDGGLRVSVSEGGYFCPKTGFSPTWSFSPNKAITCLMIGLELLIFLSSILVGFFRRNESVKSSLMMAAWSSSFVVIFVCLVLPIQSFLVNRASFPYGLTALTSELLINAICIFVVSCIVLTVFSYVYGRWICAAVMGLVVYFYLATGIMAAGLPTLDGDFRLFAADRFRQKLDMIVMVACVGGFAIGAKWICQAARWVVAGFCVMFMASLLDVRVEDKPVTNNSIGGAYCSFDEMSRSGVYSKSRNVIVLVLDSVSTEMAQGVLEEDETIRASFDGFTIYANNIGMHNITPLGLPGLVIGKHLEDLRNLKAHGAAVAGQYSFIAPYASKDIPSFALLDLVPNFHWTNRLVKESNVETDKSDSDKPNILKRINDLQAWNLFEIVRFRMTPFRFKYQMAFLTMKDWPMFDRGSSETRLYPSLARYPVGDEKMTLHVYHTEGCHFPFQVGKHGERLPEPLQNYEGMYNKTFFAFTNLAKLFAALKEKGVYDNSTIIVTADHGANHTMHEVPVVDGMAYEASKPFPMLLVKPAKANGELRYSYIPTSHTKIAPYVCALLNDDTINAEDYLRATNRMYRDFNPATFSRHDYYFDDEGKCVKVESTK